MRTIWCLLVLLLIVSRAFGADGSAGMERRTEALFAGEPGSGKPNSYSEFNGFTLPNTQMHGSISSIWH